MDGVTGALRRVAKDPRGEFGTAVVVALTLAVVVQVIAKPRSLGAFVNKCRLFVLGGRHMLFSKDKKWPKQPDAGSLEPQQVQQEVQLVFIRHGESEWNDIFNKGFKPSFLGRLFGGIVREVLKLFSTDSVFIDSPLSAEGIRQARGLALYLAAPVGESPSERALKDLIKRAPGAPPSVVAASNLRRAIATGAVALTERLQRPTSSGGKEPVFVLSSLQEITVNIDALSVTPARTDPDIPGLGVAYDASNHKGNKTLKSNGAIRMREFCDWACSRPKREAVIAVGHSLWFKSFFDVYLPKSADSIARKRKMSNCSCVALTLQKGAVAGQVVYRIKPESVMVLYGGFM